MAVYTLSLENTQREWKTSIRRPIRALSMLTVLLVLPAVSQAQDISERKIVDELAREESIRVVPKPQEELGALVIKPPWRDLEPPEFTSMLFAITVAADAIPELSASDKAVLSAARGRIGSLRIRAARHIDGACWEVLSGRFAGNDGAREVGALFALGDRIQEEDAIAFFEEVTNSLSEEGRGRLVKLKDDVFANNTTANRMDWAKYAELAPEEMLDRVTRRCEKRHGSSATDSVCWSTNPGGTLWHIVFIFESEYDDPDYLGVFGDATVGQYYGPGDYAWGITYKDHPTNTHAFRWDNAGLYDMMEGESAMVTEWNPYGAYHGAYVRDTSTMDLCYAWVYV